MSKFKTILLSVVFVLLIAVVSCRSLLEEVMPVDINKRAVEYSKIDPEELKPYPTLADAKRVRVEIIVNHRDKQISLKRLAEDDNLANGDALGFINQNIAVGESNLGMIIGSEDNPFSIMGLLFAAGLGGGGLAVGRRYFKRQGDYSPEEYEAGIVKAKNGNA